MGFLDNIPGSEKITGLDFTNLLNGIGMFVSALILFGITAIIFGIIYYRKSNKKKYNKKIFWFEEVNGDPAPIGEDWACEITIPGTTVALFYIKKKDLYLPRGTIKVGKDAYWYWIRKNREIVNFRMSNLNKVMKEAKLEFDHTDMRYAKENLLALIKRNYRDHSKVWWREYKDVIATVIFIFVMTLSFWFLLSKIGKLITSVSDLIEHTDSLIKAASTIRSGSGIAT